MKALCSRFCIAIFVVFSLFFSSAAAGQANASKRMVAAKGKSAASVPQANEKDPRLANAYRFEQGGWVYVHLEGSPANVGYQHGYLLAPEIADAFNAIKFQDTHRTQKSWDFFRKTAHEILWPKIDAEYQQELQGIADGLKARAIKMDVDDVVALNAFEEVPDYYLPWLNKREHALNAPPLKSPGNCSAFVATGSYTKDGKIVIAHNNWTSYLAGERWRIIFDIAPEKGNRILMDGFPGVITSDDDFGVNSNGIMITETTITQFEGFDPDGKPEFVRSRKALQYANSIDDYVRIMLDGNNGGYANDWLLGDRKTGEIAQFELGLKHSRIWKTKDGYFVGSNFPRDPDLIKDEAPEFDVNDRASSPNARHTRWEQLMQENKGRLDVQMAQQFLSDHLDVIENKQQPSEHTLCGHVDATPRGIPQWGWGANYPGGAVQGKAADSTMAENMSFIARAGHPCGEDFHAAEFMAAHPDYAWEKPVLRDMKAGPWTVFKSGQQAK